MIEIVYTDQTKFQCSLWQEAEDHLLEKHPQTEKLATPQETVLASKHLASVKGAPEGSAEGTPPSESAAAPAAAPDSSGVVSTADAADQTAPPAEETPASAPEPAAELVAGANPVPPVPEQDAVLVESAARAVEVTAPEAASTPE